MSKVPEPAEDVTHNPTATKQNKDTAFTGSVPEGNVSNRSGEDETGKRHSFSRKLAEEMYAKKRKLNPKAKNAVHECIVLKYLAHRVRASKNHVDGKKWFYNTIEELTNIFPYLGGTTIYEIVIRLRELGYLEISNFNKWHRDKTFWYHVPNAVCHAAESDPIYFDSAVATQTNVPAAVLFGNFEYWIKQCEEGKSPLEVEMSPSKLVELLPFSLSTIKLSLAMLSGKYIKKLSVSEPLYGIPEINHGLNPNSNGLNPNSSGSNPNSDGLNPNDITHCKPVSNPLETRSKPKPAASVFENPADDKKANDEQMHLSHHGIAPCADEQDREEMDHLKVTEPGSVSNPSPATGQPRSFSFFDAPTSGHKTEASGGSENHSTVPADIANGVNGKWPLVDALEELHQINRDNADAVEKLVSQPDALETFRQTILNISAKTMGMLDPSIMDKLYSNPDGDEVIEVVLPHFHQFLTQTSLDPSSGLTQIIYHAALECMVGAFLWPREKNDSYSHPIHSLICVTRKLYLVLWRREENARVKAIEEERAQWHEEYASVDEPKEDDASLSPAEKMRVFRNALHSLNKMGWIFYDQTHRTNIIQVTKVGCERIQKLFAVNPELTPADLLPIMDGCMEKYCAWPVPPRRFRKGDWWHSRMGHRLHMFASYLKTIVKELEMVSPVKVYLPDAKVQEEADVALAA